jgi:3-dehydroquinate synthase
MVRERDLAQVSAQFQKGAGWALAVMRPVPVLAEASALFAGVAGVPVAQYLTITTLADIGISALYCAAGSKALHSSSFLLAFAASIGLPGIAMGISRLLQRRRNAR